jgi:hypothetical protein
MASLEKTERSSESGEGRPGSGKDAGGSDAAGRAERGQLEVPPDQGDAYEKLGRGTGLDSAGGYGAESSEAKDPFDGAPKLESLEDLAKREEASRKESNEQWGAEQAAAVRRMRANTHE